MLKPARRNRSMVAVSRAALGDAEFEDHGFSLSRSHVDSTRGPARPGARQTAATQLGTLALYRGQASVLDAGPQFS